MEQFISVGEKILLGIQIIGGTALGISLGITAFYFISGGRSGSEHGKTRIVAAVVGFILLMGATALKSWLSSIVQF